MESPKKKKNTRQIPELPIEIWSKIFLNLPARAVAELKILCKSWRELINSNYFQISHVNRWRSMPVTSHLITTMSTRKRPALLSSDLVGGASSNVLHCRPLRFGPIDLAMDATVVLDCYEGLFIVLISQRYLFFCNPLTNSYLPLPFPKITGFTFLWTIAYDPSTQVYVIFYLEYLSGIGHVIYSLRVELNGAGHVRKSANWRMLWVSELALNFTGLKGVAFLASISINSKAHWLFSLNEEITGILTIDAATEKSTVRNFSAPPESGNCNFFKSNREFYCLKECEEALELWAVYDVDNPTWLKHHVIIKMDLQRRITMSRVSNVISGILKEGNLLIIRYFRNVLIYDLSLKKWQVSDIVDPKGLKHLWYTREFMSIRYSLLSWERYFTSF